MSYAASCAQDGAANGSNMKASIVGLVAALCVVGCGEGDCDKGRMGLRKGTYRLVLDGGCGREEGLIKSSPNGGVGWGSADDGYICVDDPIDFSEDACTREVFTRCTHPDGRRREILVIFTFDPDGTSAEGDFDVSQYDRWNVLLTHCSGQMTVTRLSQ